MAPTLASLDKTIVSDQLWLVLIIAIIIIWPGASAEELSSVWPARLVGRQTIGLVGLVVGQTLANLDERNKFPFADGLRWLPRNPGSHRSGWTARGRSVHSPPVTCFTKCLPPISIKRIKVSEVTVIFELTPKLRWDCGVPAVWSSEGDFCWPEDSIVKHMPRCQLIVTTWFLKKILSGPRTLKFCEILHKWPLPNIVPCVPCVLDPSAHLFINR